MKERRSIRERWNRRVEKGRETVDRRRGNGRSARKRVELFGQVLHLVPCGIGVTGQRDRCTLSYKAALEYRDQQRLGKPCKRTMCETPARRAQRP